MDGWMDGFRWIKSFIVCMCGWMDRWMDEWMDYRQWWMKSLNGCMDHNSCSRTQLTVSHAMVTSTECEISYQTLTEGNTILRAHCCQRGKLLLKCIKKIDWYRELIFHTFSLINWENTECRLIFFSHLLSHNVKLFRNCNRSCAAGTFATDGATWDYHTVSVLNYTNVCTLLL